MKKYNSESIINFRSFSYGNFLFKLNFQKILIHYPVKPTKNICCFYSVKEMYCINFLIIFDNLSIISWLNTSLTKKSSAKLLNLLKTFFLSSSIDKEHLTSWKKNKLATIILWVRLTNIFVEQDLSKILFP